MFDELRQQLTFIEETILWVEQQDLDCEKREQVGLLESAVGTLRVQADLCEALCWSIGNLVEQA